MSDLIHFLFVCDEHEFLDDRFRVQLAFAMLIEAYTGCRPGSIVVSSTRWRLNDGLLYQDVILQAERRNDALHYVMTIRLRYRKSRPNEVYDDMLTTSSFANTNLLSRVRYVLHELPSNRWLCPVSYFLALAFRDGVFDSVSDGVVDVPISNPSDLKRLDIPPGRNNLLLKYKARQAQWPIIRAHSAQRVSDTDTSVPRIMTVGRQGLEISDLGVRAKFGKKITNYSLRRGQAMKAHGKLLLTHMTFPRLMVALASARSVAEQKAVMGHVSDSMIDHYIGHTITLDTQACFLNMPQQQDQIERAVGIAAHRDLRAPSAPHSSPLLPRNSKPRRRDKANSTFNKEYFKFFEDGAKVVIHSGTVPQQGSSAGEVNVRPQPSSFLQARLRHHGTRQRVIDVMFSTTNPDQVPLETTVDSLFQLANGRLDTFPGIPFFKGNDCPYCKDTINTKGTIDYEHLLDCRGVSELGLRWACVSEKSTVCLWRGCQDGFYKAFELEELIDHNTQHLSHLTSFQCQWLSCERSFLSREDLYDHVHQEYQFLTWDTTPWMFFCRECTEWSYCELDWERHCERHLQDLHPYYCGLLTWRGRILIPPKCPFCLGNLNLQASKRYHQFSSMDALRVHISNHLRTNYLSPGRCPHLHYDLSIESTDELLQHFSERHQIFQKRERDRKRKEQDSEIESSPNTWEDGKLLD